MKWYDEAVFYHIYPLGFCGAPLENDGVSQEHHFDKLIEWIPHIKHLGCNSIYIGPLFESGKHGYDTYDYKLVDRRLGTNEDFINYVAKCHEEGIKVIVDGVFNHTGRGFFAFQDLLSKREQSEYRDWYCNVNFGGNNEYNDGLSYEAWAGHNMLPKLNQKNPKVKEYLFDVIRFWATQYHIDGIRLDAADVLDFQFMKEMRVVANEVKEDFWLMGEVIHGDYSRWVNDETLHSVTNYELHKGLYSGHNDQNYFEIAHSVKRLLGIVKNQSLYTFLDNHDVERIASKLKKKEHLFPLYLLDFALPGIPSIYYGSEFGIAGVKEKHSDVSLRPCLSLADYMEGDSYKEPYAELIQWISALGKAKQEYKELSKGEYKEALLTNRQFAFGRYLENSCVIAAVNNDEKEIALSIPVAWKEGKCETILGDEKAVIRDGKLNIVLEGNSGGLFYSCNID